MSSVSRSAQFAKVHKVLKKYYKPVIPTAERPVLEHLLFACCLEDARYEVAEEAFAALVHTFFDWNEVRVTSLSELSEVMAALPDPRAAANRVKRILHAVFEEMYSFDLEEKRKKNLGPTVKWLETMDGASVFTAAYVVQSALGGHSIPIDSSTMAVLRVLDLVTDKDVSHRVVPGLDRAVAKSKGKEFASLLHSLGADFAANPFSPQVRDILLQIDPEAAKRFPKRRVPRPAKAVEAPAQPAAPSRPSAAGGKKKKPASGKGDSQPSTNASAKQSSEDSKKAGKKSSGHAPAEKPAKKTAGKQASAAEGLAKRKPR